MLSRASRETRFGEDILWQKLEKWYLGGRFTTDIVAENHSLEDIRRFFEAFRRFGGIVSPCEKDLAVFM